MFHTFAVLKDETICIQVINHADYKRPWYLFNGHLESIIPYKAYKIYEIEYERERIELSDGDFLDVDWIRSANDKLLVISHALEGNSRDYFVERAAKYYRGKGYDILMWHFRSCSKEMNRLPRFYHTGDTKDLDTVIGYGLASAQYEEVFLLGFSMGGTTVINYLGGSHQRVKNITAAAVFSTPLDLKETSARLSRGFSQVYGRSFLKKWRSKIRKKAIQFPEVFDLSKMNECKTLDELHETFTVKLHGFNSIQEYYKKSSSSNFLEKVKTPLLVLSAKNDPLLGSESFRKASSPFVHQLHTETGGHLGFSLSNKPYSWMEIASEHFFSNLNGTS